MQLKTMHRAMNVISANPALFIQGTWARLRSLQSLPIKNNRICVNGVQVPYHSEYGSYYHKLYYGSRDVAIRAVMRKYLQKGDTFIDVGANIGRLSAVGLGLVGQTGQVHSFEPVPHFSKLLEGLAAANPKHHFIVNQCAAGDQEGQATIVLSRTNIGMNTLVPNLLDPDDQGERFEVKVIKLDDYLEEKKLQRIAVIKIDAEGYDFPVLKGLQRFFSETSHRPAIICELGVDAYPRLELSLEDFSDYMASFGYQSYSMINTKQRVDLHEVKGTDALFLANSTGGL